MTDQKANLPPSLFNLKPARMEIQVNNIPHELIEKPRWVGWKWMWREGENGKPGRWTKPPFDAKTGKLASSTNPETWASFDEAFHEYQLSRFDGIGFVLNGEYTGVDFDDSRDPSTGRVFKPALSEILTLNSYTEVSPSGTGFKTLARANLRKGGHHDDNRGIFDRDRYFCLTGHLFDRVSRNIEKRQAEIDVLIKKRWPQDLEDRTEGSSTKALLPLEDSELIEEIKASGQGAKFEKLWSGDWSDYSSQSEGDFALCLILSFWTGRDQARIDRLFRTPGLYRKKWDSHRYAERTIEKAVSLTTETFHCTTTGEGRATDKTGEKGNSRKIDYRLTTLSDVFEYPEPSFLIEEILVEKTLSALGAYTGVGKSLLVLTLIKAIQTGEPLWNKYQVTKTGPVLLVDEETPHSFLRERIEKMGFDKNLPFYFLHFQDVRLDREDCFNALMERIGEVEPVLVVIDSLIRVHRQKEDDSVSMALVMDRLRKIVNSGTTVLVIHHHRKGEGPLSQKLRGSSDIPGGIDIEYALTPKDDCLIFQSVKTRIKPLSPIRLRMETDGDHVTGISYAGVEIGERGEVLTEVLSILRGKEEAGVKELHDCLRDRDMEVGINTLRDILRGAAGRELTEERGLRGKKVYRINPASQLHDPIYTRETVKVKEGDSSDIADRKAGREGQSLDSQGLAGSFTASRKALSEGEINLYEGEI